MLKKHVIITASDAKYGDFLINHWLKSLKDNVNLKDIDVVVLDYGLKKEQVEKLKKEGIMMMVCRRDGHVTNIRFRDMGRFLLSHDYDQVLAIDSADIIFQTDIRKYFVKDKKYFRVAFMELETLFTEVYSLGNFRPKDIKKIKAVLKNKKTINAGVIFGPADKFIALGQACQKLITNKNNYGPDQIVVNYELYKAGFKRLDNQANFLITTTDQGFTIKDGIFYSDNGVKISIVHNGGRMSPTRPIINFGYGKGFNIVNYPLFFSNRFLYKLLSLVKEKIIKIK